MLGGPTVVWTVPRGIHVIGSSIVLIMMLKWGASRGIQLDPGYKICSTAFGTTVIVVQAKE